MPTCRPRPSSRLVLLLSVVSLLAAAAVLTRNRVGAQQLAATYTHGSLSVTIPYHAPREASGRLIAEILDPEDHVLGRSERTVNVVKGDGSWQQSITPDQPISFDDIIWQRVRYRFEYAKPHRSPAHRRHRIHLADPPPPRRPHPRPVANTSPAAGRHPRHRLRRLPRRRQPITDGNRHGPHRTFLPIQPGETTASRAPLFSGRLNRRGTVEAQFHFPAGLTGSYDLHYVADTPIGSTEFTQPIPLKDKASILLTTEKPIYQPGQTIHIRALALDRADTKPTPPAPSPSSSKTRAATRSSRSATTTDDFGIASAEFSLADEVNLGTYHLRALMGDAASPPTRAEIALNVERYVLPKFKVAVEFTEKDGKPKTRLPARRPRHRHRPRQLLLRQAGRPRRRSPSRSPAWTSASSRPHPPPARPTRTAPITST